MSFVKFEELRWNIDYYNWIKGKGWRRKYIYELDADLTAAIKAECEADKSVYAVKTLLYLFCDEATAASFKNEVRISSEVSGEHVIHYIYAHDGDEYPELPPYIIMEYAEGGTLADQIEERKKTNSPYSKEELRNLFLQQVFVILILL